jgi:hypothetical protein
MISAFNRFCSQLNKRGCIGGGAPSAPAPPPVVAPPPPVDSQDPETKAREDKARSDEERRAKLAKGRNSTILTGASGITEKADVQKAQVLGEGSPASQTLYKQ